jgi:hypothetical protein
MHAHHDKNVHDIATVFNYKFTLNFAMFIVRIYLGVNIAVRIFRSFPCCSWRRKDCVDFLIICSF